MASHLRHRRASNFDGSEMGDLNFAQRLLMANENAVTNIADLWVAAAMNVDNEDPFESDTEQDAEGGDTIDDYDSALDEDHNSIRGRQTSRDRLTGSSVMGSSATVPFGRSSLSPSRRQQTPRRPSHGRPVHQGRLSFSQPLDTRSTTRRFSSSVPSIFAHPGVKTPSAVLDAQQLLLSRTTEEAVGEPLAPIIESRRVSQVGSEVQYDSSVDVEANAEKQPSLASQLPILVIVQYGLLALHTNMHDQIFMSYLVSYVLLIISVREYLLISLRQRLFRRRT